MPNRPSEVRERRDVVERVVDERERDAVEQRGDRRARASADVASPHWATGATS